MYKDPAHCLVFLYFWTFLVTSRMPMILPPGGQGSSSGISCPSFQNPATSIELIEHQLGNTGLTVQSVGKAGNLGVIICGTQLFTFTCKCMQCMLACQGRMVGFLCITNMI